MTNDVLKSDAQKEIDKLSKMSKVKQHQYIQDKFRDILINTLPILESQAERGNTLALQTIIDRVIAKKRYDTVRIHLCNEFKCIDDIIDAGDSLIKHTQTAKIAPEQAKAVANLLNYQLTNIQSKSIDERLERIEEALKLETRKPTEHYIDAEILDNLDVNKNGDENE